MSAFLTPLSATETDEIGGLWTLDAPLVYLSDLAGRIDVPAGFVTDFASVPRVLGIYDLEGGRCNKAAVVHDWLYTTQCVTRDVADQVLREAILASGYGRFTAGVFYAAVRIGGASHWKAPNQPQPANVAALIPAAQTA